MQTCALTACAIAALFFIVSALWGGKGSIPSGTPPVVIVTVLDPSYNKEYIKNIQENRIEYAKKHGMPLIPADMETQSLIFSYRIHNLLCYRSRL